MNPYLAIQRVFICVKEDHDEWSLLLRGQITHEECRMIASFLQQQHVMGRGWKITDHEDPIFRNGFYNTYHEIMPKQETVQAHYWHQGTVTTILDELLTMRHKIVKFVSWQQFLNQRIPHTTDEELHQAVERLSEQEIIDLKYNNT